MVAAWQIPLGLRTRLKRWGSASWRVVYSFLKPSISWLVPMLLTASATAYLSYLYNQRANTQLLIQQQRVADLQQFRSSGAQLDQALGRMSDAIVDDAGLEEARHEMRSAIGRNIADAEAARSLLGSDADAYVTGLAELRSVVDNVATPESGQKLWQGSINLIAARRKLVRAAESRTLQ